MLSALTSKLCASWRLYMLQDPRLRGFLDMSCRYLPCLSALVKAYDSRVGFCVQAHSDAIRACVRVSTGLVSCIAMPSIQPLCT